METKLNFGDIEIVLEQIMGKSPGFEKMVGEVIRGEGIIHPSRWMIIFTDTLMEQLKIIAKKSYKIPYPKSAYFGRLWQSLLKPQQK